jgi:hypothetical protein
MVVRIYDAEDGPDGGVLWTAERPAEWLADKKSKMPGPIYRAQYRNDPSGLRGARYDEGWLEFYTSSQLPPWEELVGYQGGDPATSEDLKSDYFGHSTVAKHIKTGIVYVLGLDFVRKPATQHHDYLKQQYVLWSSKGLNIIVVRVESIGPQQGTVQRVIDDSRRDPDLMMPLEAFKPKGSKEVRFDSLLPHYQNGTILFPGEKVGDKMEMSGRIGFQEFLEEYRRFPLGGRDDVLDALYISVEGCLQGIAAAVAGKRVEGNKERALRLLDSGEREKERVKVKRTESARDRIISRTGRESLFHSGLSLRRKR